MTINNPFLTFNRIFGKGKVGIIHVFSIKANERACQQIETRSEVVDGVPDYQVDVIGYVLTDREYECGAGQMTYGLRLVRGLIFRLRSLMCFRTRSTFSLDSLKNIMIPQGRPDQSDFSDTGRKPEGMVYPMIFPHYSFCSATYCSA